MWPITATAPRNITIIPPAIVMFFLASFINNTAKLVTAIVINEKIVPIEGLDFIPLAISISGMNKNSSVDSTPIKFIIKNENIIRKMLNDKKGIIIVGISDFLEIYIEQVKREAPENIKQSAVLNLMSGKPKITDLNNEISNHQPIITKIPVKMEVKEIILIIFSFIAILQ